jgi:hypothetical protein
MLNIVNERPLSVDERKSILMRALHAVPYYHLTEIDILDFAARKQQYVYKEKSHIYIDFYVTGFRANLNQVRDDTGRDFDVSVYLADKGISLYGFTASTELPASQIYTDGRFNRIAHDPIFQDVQRESFPFLVEAGEDIITQIRTVKNVASPSMFNAVLSGFNSIAYPYLTDIETEKINQSLDKETVFQTFQIDVDNNTGATPDGITSKIYNIVNDSVPRLILGFGVVDGQDATDIIIESEVDIIDATRHLRLTNRAIPLELLAPRQPKTSDTHIYYLPIEHYFMPFGNLQFNIKNTPTASPVADNPYKLIMLTRTI